jgi:hypothetical protein
MDVQSATVIQFLSQVLYTSPRLQFRYKSLRRKQKNPLGSEETAEASSDPFAKFYNGCKVVATFSQSEAIMSRPMSTLMVSFYKLQKLTNIGQKNAPL